MNRTEQFNTKNFEAEEWQKLFYKHQQQYIRKRLEAIKYLHEGKTRQEVMDLVDCARQSLITWIDLYCQGGLKVLTMPMKSARKQGLGREEKAALKKMLLEQKPTDYGIDRQIWTGKNIIEVMNQRWGSSSKIVASMTSSKRSDCRIKKPIEIMRMVIRKPSRNSSRRSKKTGGTQAPREASVL